jgi:hypothetical protein
MLPKSFGKIQRGRQKLHRMLCKQASSPIVAGEGPFDCVVIHHASPKGNIYIAATVHFSQTDDAPIDGGRSFSIYGGQRGQMIEEP